MAVEAKPRLIWPVQHVRKLMNGQDDYLNNQKKECGCVSNDLVIKLIEQNNLLLKNQNTLTEQNNQLIQINNEQNAQINELLEHLDLGEEETKSGYLDG